MWMKQKKFLRFVVLSAVIVVLQLAANLSNLHKVDSKYGADDT